MDVTFLRHQANLNSLSQTFVSTIADNYSTFILNVEVKADYGISSVLFVFECSPMIGSLLIMIIMYVLFICILFFYFISKLLLALPKDSCGTRVKFANGNYIAIFLVRLASVK